jgi:hypothetical protein
MKDAYPARMPLILAAADAYRVGARCLAAYSAARRCRRDRASAIWSSSR